MIKYVFGEFTNDNSRIVDARSLGIYNPATEIVVICRDDDDITAIREYYNIPDNFMCVSAQLL